MERTWYLAVSSRESRGPEGESHWGGGDVNHDSSMKDYADVEA